MMYLWFIMVVMTHFATSRAIYVFVFLYGGILEPYASSLSSKINFFPVLLHSWGCKRHELMDFEFLIILTEGRLYDFLII